MERKVSTDDIALQQKMRVLRKLRDNTVRTENDLQNLTTEGMLLIPNITLKEMAIIIDLQKAVRNGKLYSYLIDVADFLSRDSVSGDEAEERRWSS